MTIESETKLQGLIDKAHLVLFTACSIFPFQIVPDRISVDMTKITIEHRFIFQSEDIRTVLLQDVLQVEVTYILFLASVIINNTETSTVTFLRKKDAVRAKQIITGLLIARRERLDLKDVVQLGLADKIAEIGKLHATS